MKKIISLNFLGLFLVLFSATSFAEKITITGEPVVVREESGVYVPSTAFTPSSDYYYVTVGDTRRVCYKEVQPALAKVDLGMMSMRVGDSTVQVHCYTYSPDYFVVGP